MCILCCYVSVGQNTLSVFLVEVSFLLLDNSVDKSRYFAQNDEFYFQFHCQKNDVSVIFSMIQYNSDAIFEDIINIESP